MEKHKRKHTEMEYLNSMQRKYKPEYQINRILKIRNSLVKLQKDFKKLKATEIKIKKPFK